MNLYIKRFLPAILLLLCLGVFPVAAQVSGPVPDAQSPQGMESMISLDVKDMEIIDLLKIFSSRTGLNIVAGRNVKGRVTIFLKDVRVEDALRLILEANELAFQREGNIVTVMTEREYEQMFGAPFRERTQMRSYSLRDAKAADVAKTLLQMKTVVGRVIPDESSNTLVLIEIPERLKEMEQLINKLDRPIETRVFELRYAKVEELGEKLRTLLTGNVGQLSVDERTGKVVISDYAEVVAKAEEVINAFDERDRQVLIDARIIEVLLGDEFRLGIDWEAVFNKLDGSLEHSMSLPSTASPTSTSGDSSFTITLGTLAENNFNTVIQALESMGRTDTLSNPRILAMNNEEARILVGTKEAFITSTVTVPATGSTITSDNVQLVDVGVSLTVTPIISSDGYITMKVKPEVSTTGTPVTLTNPDGSERSKIPIVKTQETETQVIVRDGEMVLLGGLIQDKIVNERDQIPIVGRIPVVGALFSNRKEYKSKSELVILLTPHIMKGHEEPEWEASEYALEPEFEKEQEPGREFIDPLAIPEYVPQPRAPQPSLSPLQLVSSTPTVSEFKAAQIAYSEYRRALSRKVAARLQDRPSTRRYFGAVRVQFTLTQDGHLVGMPEVLGSEDEALGEFVASRLVEASPFEPFPQALKRPQEAFEIEIAFE
ncbi:MAG: hypothetical protein JW937_07675 [Candidatus Omnitrophica bacterium]|nr:hypothetical protein [Candidatus Omnitrophota bacterium]